jgi:hypothetical protein
MLMRPALYHPTHLHTNDIRNTLAVIVRPHRTAVATSITHHITIATSTDVSNIAVDGTT